MLRKLGDERKRIENASRHFRYAPNRMNETGHTTEYRHYIESVLIYIDHRLAEFEVERFF